MPWEGPSTSDRYDFPRSLSLQQLGDVLPLRLCCESHLGKKKNSNPTLASGWYSKSVKFTPAERYGST